jgi:ABC-type transport system substrate-binding protein
MTPVHRGWSAVLALVLVACGDDRVPPPLGLSAVHADDTPKRGGRLRLATFSDVRSLDAAVAFDEVSHAIEQLLYAKLIDFSPTGEGFEPDLAERWTVSEDGLHYVFHLRMGVTFQDGSPFDASDVKRSLERMLSPDTPCPASSFYERIAGYSAYVGRKAAHLDGVKILGDHLVAIDLSEPDATLLATLALPVAAPVCRSAGATYDREFSTRACGAGPFRLRSWEAGRSVTLDRFDGYYRPGLPHLDGVDWQLGVPAFTQRFKFEAGEIDLLRELGEADLSRYLRSPEWQGHGAWEPGKTIHSFFMNTERAPFDRVEVRRAVVAAIDREAVAKIRPGSIRPASRLVPPAVPGFDPSPGQRFDYAAALDHMARAGFPYDPATKKGGWPAEIDFVTNGGTFDQEAAEIYQQQLARIGIRIHIKTLSYAAYLAESSRRGAAAMGTDGWAMDYPDPSDFFEPILHSRAIADEDSQNRAFFRNARFDELLDRGRRETRWSERLAIYRQAEDIVLSEAPWAIVYTKQWYELWHPYLRGYRIHPALSEHVAFTWLDADARARAARAAHNPLSQDALALRLARWAAPPRRR